MIRILSSFIEKLLDDNQGILFLVLEMILDAGKKVEKLILLFNHILGVFLQHLI